LLGGSMKIENAPFPNPEERTPADVLRGFVAAFESKGWLNQTLRIMHREERYRVFCSEEKFFAYRINDHFGVSWGFPGWPVCIVTHEEIIEDSETAAAAALTSVHEWLRCIASDDFERI
jgi:hypothetical protein